MSGKTIEEVLGDRTDEWMDLPGVVGTAIGVSEGRPCIKVLTSSETASVRAKIPATIEGYQVAIEQIGEIRALDQAESD
ncbi:MAG: hypothetical protein JSU70_04355 [Phycisphaerales bacterium]|nr:MAG: hypothetical protein JSU70_04355 [Phycisphaerales bacterium]